MKKKPKKKAPKTALLGTYEMRGCEYMDGVSAHDLARTLLEFPDLRIRVRLPSPCAARSGDVGNLTVGTYGDYMAVFLNPTDINDKGKQ